jgi:hypothetical protein
VILILLGIVALGWQGVGYFTTHDTVAQFGPFSVQADRTHVVPLAPIVSGVAVVAGIVLLAVGLGKRAT